MLTGPRRRDGFTLVELLVVLAILVLLFGLLFAPMMTSLDMARQGQSRAKMQDTVRYAMDDVRRTVGNAIYVLPPRVVTPTAASNLAYVNPAEITVVSPRRDTVTGLLMSPLQPETRLDPNDTSAGARPWMSAVRYTVHPRSGRLIRNEEAAAAGFPAGTTVSVGENSNGQIYQPVVEDPFVLFRQSGIWFPWDNGTPGNTADDVYTFGSFNAAAAFVPNRPVSENALTGVDGYDVPCTASVCDACGIRQPGFRAYDLMCPACGQAAGYTYLFQDATFVPQRVAGEQLEMREDGTLYQAGHGSWTGYGHLDPLTSAPALRRRALDARVVFYRWNNGSYSEVQYDSYVAGTRGNPTLDISWDADSGAIRAGHMYEQVVTLALAGGNTTVSISPARPEDQADVAALDAVGPLAPSGYRIDSSAAAPPPDPAIVVPSSVRLRVVVNLRNNAGSRWWDLVRTEQYEQDEIGPWQFAVRRSLPPANWAPWISADWATNMDILFNNTDPNGPIGPRRFEALFGPNTVQDVQLRVQYWARRNADLFRGPNSTGRDDIVRVDYYTRDVVNAGLKVSEFQDYIDDANLNMVIPPPPPAPRQASLADTIIVRNAAS